MLYREMSIKKGDVAHAPLFLLGNRFLQQILQPNAKIGDGSISVIDVVFAISELSVVSRKIQQQVVLDTIISGQSHVNGAHLQV